MEFFLANMIALIHGIVVVPVLTVGAVVIGVRAGFGWLEWLFLIIAVGAILSFVITGDCFLTTWENALRRSVGASGYSQGFVAHYLNRAGLPWSDFQTTVLFTFTTAFGLGILAERFKYINK